jgi:hypothetical protein
VKAWGIIAEGAGAGQTIEEDLDRVHRVLLVKAIGDNIRTNQIVELSAFN